MGFNGAQAASLCPGITAALAVIFFLVATITIRQTNKRMQWEARSWMDNENLGFSRERSKLPVRIMSDNIDELTWKIASDYPKWLTSNFMPFLSLKTDASGRASLCVPFLNVKLLTFSPLRRARKGGGWWYRVEGGLLADRPESGTLAFDLRAPFSLAGTGDKIVPGEFRTRLDGFRSRIAGTPAPLSKAIREHERSKSLFSTKNLQRLSQRHCRSKFHQELNLNHGAQAL